MNKGFTLIELLATIVIMALILLLVMPAITALQENNENKPYEYYGDSIEEAAKIYVNKEGEDITDIGSSKWQGCIDITYEDLINSGLLKPFDDENYDCSVDTKVRYTKDEKGRESYDYNMTCVDKSGNKVYEHIGIENDDECTVVDLSDTTPPECGEAIGASTEWTKENREITMTCTDRNGCESVTKVFDKTTKVGYITVVDGKGNKRNCPVNVYVDKTGPKCKSSGGGGWTKNAVTLTGTCSDDESGCADDTLTVTKTYDAEINSTTETPGVVRDKVGNETTCPNQSVKIDRTPPNYIEIKGHCASIEGDPTNSGKKAYVTLVFGDGGSGLGIRNVTAWDKTSGRIVTPTANYNGVSTASDLLATRYTDWIAFEHTICDVVGNCQNTLSQTFYFSC